MPSMKIIKRRIASVNSTQKITKAMNLVANSKLQKSRTRLQASGMQFDEMCAVIGQIRNVEESDENVYVKPREIKSAAYIVITSDRGMCGAYNVNISNAALKIIDAGKNEKIIAVGTKGWEFFRRSRKNIHQRYIGVQETAFYRYADEISRMVIKMYQAGEIDAVYVAYTKYETMMSQTPVVEKVLPIGGEFQVNRKTDYMRYEPDANTVLNYLVPLYMDVFIYGAMVESSVCEQAMRMVSMDAATNNAEEIIDDLTLEYNRMRQSAITQELNEIVNGANALK